MSFSVVQNSSLNCLMQTCVPRHLPLYTRHVDPLLTLSSKTRSTELIRGMIFELCVTNCSTRLIGGAPSSYGSSLTTLSGLNSIFISSASTADSRLFAPISEVRRLCIISSKLNYSITSSLGDQLSAISFGVCPFLSRTWGLALNFSSKAIMFESALMAARCNGVCSLSSYELR